MMTLLLAIQPSGGNWSPAAWRRRFAQHDAGRAIVIDGEDVYDPAAIRYVATWKPKPGLIATLPNLAVAFNLGAGVDALLKDPTMPRHVPIVRVVDADLTARMTEYVVWQVLDLHRQGPQLRSAQARAAWVGPEQAAAKSLRVGLMGLGEIARDASEVLVRLGFRVAGWSRTAKTLAGVETFAGDGGLDAFLARTDVLVVLLPLTPDTHGILNAALFRKLARDGVLGRPAIINAGRGGLQIERDIVACLDDGTLGHAVLDVFETEPLPASSPLWRHPGVTVTPHNAADSDPDEISRYVVAQMQAHERGDTLRNVVDRARGY
jgi:glyoxylate/hydroxypyruvate reductase